MSLEVLSEGTEKRISEEGLEALFKTARTHNKWQNRPISDELLKQVYDLVKLAPTSANTSPARFVFLKSEEAKTRLLPGLAEMNVEKAKTASVVALIAYDTEFYEKLPKLMPYRDLKPMFVGKAELIEEYAFRNSSLQGAYLILAARALGLDCGPMSGFDAGKVNAEFFPDGKVKINFICNLGYGDPSGLNPKLPRLDFEEACEIL